eukprot:TRINITY_DN3270_c0_g1_i9.p1 TRINITY_DN3270_c0_g1~~TRINITY_DN3270_c0_g1_i9.p1  ORF type:complete len:132 (-),score=3.82 TRINITY_DN3270_c0_g1_i9:149-544(-)
MKYVGTQYGDTVNMAMNFAAADSASPELCQEVEDAEARLYRGSPDFLNESTFALINHLPNNQTYLSDPLLDQDKINTPYSEKERKKDPKQILLVSIYEIRIRFYYSQGYLSHVLVCSRKINKIRCFSLMSG